MLAITSRAHLVLFILEWNLEVGACMDHGLHGREDVLVDQSGEALLILICVTRPVDYSHLLDEGALATLSRTLKGVKTPEISQIREEEDKKRKLNLTLQLTSCFKYDGLCDFCQATNKPAFFSQTTSSLDTYFCKNNLSVMPQTD